MAIVLQKEITKVNLVKQELSLDGQQTEVYVVLDISGSMRDYFEDGIVQDIMTRAMALGLGFDANKQIDVITFGAEAHYFGTVNERNHATVARDIYSKYPLENSTYYAQAIKMVSDKVDDSNRSGIFRRKSGGPLKNPIYVAFFTDGDNQDQAATTKLITELSGRGIFFQFIGIGYDGFGYLKKLDELQGRVLDNAGFFAAYDVEGQDDTVMYRKMIKEFATWIPQARAKGFIV